MLDYFGTKVDYGIDKLNLNRLGSNIVKGKHVVGPLYTLIRAALKSEDGLSGRFFLSFALNSEDRVIQNKQLQLEQLEAAFFALHGANPLMGQQGMPITWRLYALLNSSSFNATGGVGSALKHWIEMLFSLPGWVQSWFHPEAEEEREDAESFQPQQIQQSQVSAEEKGLERLRIYVEKPKIQDRLPELAETLSRARAAQALALDNNQRYLETRNRASSFAALEFYFRDRVLGGARMLQEGVRLHLESTGTRERTWKGLGNSRQRGEWILGVDVGMDPVASPDGGGGGLGEAGEYVEGFDTSAAGGFDGPVNQVLRSPQQPQQGAADTTAAQTRRLEDLVVRNDLAKGTLDSINGIVADELSWNLQELGSTRAARQTEASDAEHWKSSCTESALEALNAYQSMQAWSTEVAQIHTRPTVLQVFGIQRYPGLPGDLQIQDL